MAKLIFELATFLVIGSIFAAGLPSCSGIDPGIDEIVKTIMSKADCEKYSDQGALWFGDHCCVDIDKNKLCDDKVKPCKNECNDNDCIGREWNHCVKDESGCDVWVSQGRIVGKCNVECLDNSYCDDDKACNENSKCKNIECEEGQEIVAHNCVDIKIEVPEDKNDTEPSSLNETNQSS